MTMETKPVAANATWMFSATFDEVVDFIRYVFIIYMYVGKRLFTGGFYKARYTFFNTITLSQYRIHSLDRVGNIRILRYGRTLPV